VDQICTCTARNRHVVIPHEADGLAMLRGSYWPLGYAVKVAFLGGSTETQDRVMAHARRWSQYGELDFVAVAAARTSGAFDVLVGFDQQGYWSMIGTGSRQVAGQGQQTLNLQGFDSRLMPESEWTRVVVHEFGHACGNLHEQQRPEVVAMLDARAVIAEFERTQGWSAQEIRDQILTPFDPSTVDETPTPDLLSIMMYSFDASLTLDHRPIVGGSDITDADKILFSKVYPGRWTPGTTPTPVPPPVGPAPPLPIPPVPAVNPGLPEVSIGGKAALGHVPGLMRPAEFWLAVAEAQTLLFQVAVDGSHWLRRSPTVDIISAGGTGGARLAMQYGSPASSGLARVNSGAFTIRVFDPNPLHAGLVYVKATRQGA
jgi:hypothetical protein